MAFSGTLQKCKACNKVVHFIEMLTADGISRITRLASNAINAMAISRTPSKLSAFFSGTQEKCAVCNKTVYPLEKVTVEEKFYHKLCFRCAHGGCKLTPSSYAALDGYVYCKPHFAQLFKEKGSYTHLTKNASVKKNVVTVPDVAPPEHPKSDPEN
ncbi:GATA type zinc finger transcription factor family protein [Actinidia rufa]|uniref:GATA type zinc finger transcription factor family protein n=1 Tax=Actinidia rufa TaxID=165716 RepID=A0A7J0DKI5_9ERIC|nr:GATA type zinc finger transcription factor family protein [Actinidia rufa]